tara:strand:+ start:87 stop:434 length:348 start_codon:yes stop_codon:yes gene_type:complete
MPVYTNKKDTIKDYIQQYVSKEENSSIWCDTYHFTYWAYAEEHFPDIYFKDSYKHYEELMKDLKKRFSDSTEEDFIAALIKVVANLEATYIKAWREASDTDYKTSDEYLAQTSMC